MLTIPFLDVDDANSLNINVLQRLTDVPAHPIDCVNWAEYPYRPEVTVKTAQTPTCLLLQYRVRESGICAQCLHPNEAVWTDSCVEFFVSMDNCHSYYNLEINCIGTPLLRHNLNRNEFTLAPPDIMQKINTLSTLGRAPLAAQTGDFRWMLTAAVPYACFFKHSLHNLRGQKLRLNFYKCGNQTPQPHYLSMFPINASQPDFHLPAFFGEAEMA